MARWASLSEPIRIAIQRVRASLSKPSFRVINGGEADAPTGCAEIAVVQSAFRGVYISASSSVNCSILMVQRASEELIRNL